MSQSLAFLLIGLATLVGFYDLWAFVSVFRSDRSVTVVVADRGAAGARRADLGGRRPACGDRPSSRLNSAEERALSQRECRSTRITNR